MSERGWQKAPVALALLLLVLPAIGVRAWMAATFPSYLHGQFGQDLVFTLAWCGLLVAVARWRLLGLASVPVVALRRPWQVFHRHQSCLG